MLTYSKLNLNQNILTHKHDHSLQLVLCSMDDILLDK